VIQLTRLNSTPIALNSDLIKFVENAPDTVITLINGDKVIVREALEDVIQRIVAFRRSVISGLPSWIANVGPDPLSGEEADRNPASGDLRRG